MPRKIKTVFWSLAALLLLGALVYLTREFPSFWDVELSEVEYVEKHYERCKTESCAEIDLTFPIYSEDSTITNQVAKYVASAFIQTEDSPNFGQDYEKGVEFFFGLFEEESYANRSFYPDWFFKVEGEEAFRSKDILSLRFFHAYFTGGAHPNSHTTFLIFDLAQDGKILEPEEIIMDRNRLTQLAEKAFRAYHEVDEQVSLEEDGRFFLEDGKFFLPQFMGYQEDYFVLIYNPYEIGPYVMGYTELKIPLQDLTNVVRMPKGWPGLYDQ